MDRKNFSESVKNFSDRQPIGNEARPPQERDASDLRVQLGELTLDTSGVVWMPKPTPNTMMPGRIEWEHLDAFTQGYVEALFASAVHCAECSAMRSGHGFSRVAFSDLAPETLAAILKDCERFCRESTWPSDLMEAGADFWRERQERSVAGEMIVGDALKSFPPLTATLGDNGKVYLRELV